MHHLHPVADAVCRFGADGMPGGNDPGRNENCLCQRLTKEIVRSSDIALLGQLSRELHQQRLDHARRRR
jgi:hypothetical protein